MKIMHPAQFKLGTYLAAGLGAGFAAQGDAATVTFYGPGSQSRYGDWISPRQYLLQVTGCR